jgi:hypothetical protein
MNLAVNYFNMLSDDLIIRIQRSLSTKDLVACIILSQRWKNIWDKAPWVKFHDRLNSVADVLKFIERMTRFAAAHDNLLLVDDLQISVDYTVELADIVNTLLMQQVHKVVKLLTSKGVKAFTVKMAFQDTDLDQDLNFFIAKAPSCLVGYNSLVELTLEGMSFVDISFDECLFGLLEILRLSSIVFSKDSDLSGLLSICPHLKVIHAVKTCASTVIKKNEEFYDLCSQLRLRRLEWAEIYRNNCHVDLNCLAEVKFLKIQFSGVGF